MIYLVRKPLAALLSAVSTMRFQRQLLYAKLDKCSTSRTPCKLLFPFLDVAVSRFLDALPYGRSTIQPLVKVAPTIAHGSPELDIGGALRVGSPDSQC